MNEPRLNLTREVFDENKIKNVIRSNEFHPTPDLIEQIQDCLNRINSVSKYFRYMHQRINDKIIRDHNNKISKLLKVSEGKCSNITGITIHTDKGNVKFNAGRFLMPMIYRLFRGEKPNMSWGGNPNMQFDYLNSDELILPIYRIDHPDSDQYFREIITACLPFGKFMKEKYHVSKNKIKVLISDLIKEILPEIRFTDSQLDETFKYHFQLTE